MASERTLVRALGIALSFTVSAEALSGASSRTATRARLPRSADAPASLVDPGSAMSVAFRLEGATSRTGTRGPDVVVFPGAGPEKSDVRFRAEGGVLEDFVRYSSAPRVRATAYRVQTSGVSGLRLVSDVLEFLDAGGAPRLRMAAPFVTDARGNHAAHVDVSGCAVDRDPSGPWGRPTVPPGSEVCRVVVSFADAPLDYPAEVDPKWTATTNTMIEARRGHTATLLATGKVLVAGGESGTTAAPVRSKTAELWDPGTGTFAATGSMTDARAFHVAARLSTDAVLVTGGAGATAALGTTELYETSAGKFRAVASLITARRAPAIAPSGTGVVVAGGTDAAGAATDAAETFDVGTEKWTDIGRLTNKRLGAVGGMLPPSSPVVVGGSTSDTVGDLASVERLSGTSWAGAPSLSQARREFDAAVLDSGALLVAGGYQGSTKKALADAEVYQSSTGSFVKVGALATARADHRLTALANGAAIVTGGTTRNAQGAVSGYLKSAELYDPDGKTWSALPDLVGARAYHTATLLADGRVLVAGGAAAATGSLDTAEVLSLDANGVACTAGASCASGFCADGFCCESACDGPCTACAVAATGKPNGTCGAVSAGKDPRGDCKDDGAPACQKDGLCDGKGACESYASTSCTANACADDADCTSGHCVDSVCCDTACSGECQACTAAKKGSGADGTCGAVKQGTDPDGECGTLGTGVCLGAGTCDGVSACKSPNEGKACAAAKCVDTETAAAAATCGSGGDCTPETTSCVPYRCDTTSAACKTTCTKDADCATGAHCTGGECARADDGAACKTGTDCTSTFCVDGVCCDQACGGQCEACDVSGNEGTCSPVSGPPHGTRTACAGSDPCGGTCNGLARTICIYPGADVSCGATGTTCTDGKESGDRCNGSGECSSAPTDCAPYACGTDACLTSCTKDGDCSSDAACTAGKCVFGATRCGDGGVVVDGGCVTPVAAVKSDGGCGCRTSPAPEGRSVAWLAVGIAGLWIRRRRRGATG
ncbi:MAG TPA: kelch repeat-containing protein [Polyangiaceae bacterium]|nr:kelch repeat-containing protein [Polyangiaceae bacterium]